MPKVWLCLYHKNPMRRSAGIICIMTVFLAGCASVDGLRQAQTAGGFHIIKGVPFFPQEDYQCGPASLAAVLNYWGVSVTPGEIAEAIYSESARGTLNIDMVIYAGERGLQVSQYSGGLKDLKEKIDAGHPLIVLVDFGFSILRADHFMVVTGYSEAGVVANSGRNEKRFIPLEDFMKSWERTKYWTLHLKK